MRFLVVSIAVLFGTAAFGAVGEKLWLTESDLPTLQSRQYSAFNNGYVVGDKDLSPGFAKFREAFLSVKTPKEVDDLLAVAERDYAKYPMDVQFAVTKLAQLRPLRSIVYKLVPPFERNKVTHGILLSQFKELAELLLVYLPSNQWKAGFDYVTAPSYYGENKQFGSILEFQDYVMAKVYPALEQAAARYTAMLNTMQRPVVWDNQLLFGFASFRDGLDRYRAVGIPEVALSLSRTHQAMQAVTFFCAYNRNDLVSVAETLGRMRGIDSIKWDWDSGYTTENSTKAVRKFSQYLVLRGDQGKELMKRSFGHLQHAVAYADLAIQVAKDAPVNDFATLKANVLDIRNREVRLRVATSKDLVSKPTALRSAITGEVVTVNVPAIFQNPPADLKAFLPTQFDPCDSKTREVETKEGGRVTFKNYFCGRATGWNAKAYAPYLNPPANKPNIGDALRVASETYGGGMIALPLSVFVH